MPRQRIKILMVLSYFHPYISGVSEYARMLAALLSKHCDVTVLTGRHEPHLPAREEMDGYTVERATAQFFLHKGYVSFDLVRRFRELVTDVDVVNFHLPMLDAAWLVSLVPKNVRIVTTYQCDIQPVGGAIDAMAVAAVNVASHRCLRRSSSIVVLSKDYASGSPVLRGLDDRIVEGFAPIKEQTPPHISQDGTSIGDRPFVVGFLGRFVEEKGIDVLADAAKIVLAQYPNARFLLAGDYASVAGGSIYPKLKPALDALGDKVQLLGKLNEERLSDFYGSLDVFVLPSTNAYEAFGMVQVEAMLTGTPVIASDMRGVRVPVMLTTNGLLFPPRDARALASAILDMAYGRWSRTRNHVIENTRAVFSNEAFLERYLKLIA